MKSQIYEPREDSYLLLDEILKQKKIDNALDMGTGSGILALELAKYVKNVVAVDINKKVIMELNKITKNSRIKNIKVVNSNIFSKVSGKFDLIVFNPPYIPTDKIEFIDLDGGKNGAEIIEKFLKDAGKYLKEKGKILFLTSSLNKNIEKLFDNCGFSYKKLSEKKIFFEKLVVWELK
jgi:release factor glutamine methyltransferase